MYCYSDTYDNNNKFEVIPKNVHHVRNAHAAELMSVYCMAFSGVTRTEKRIEFGH